MREILRKSSKNACRKGSCTQVEWRLRALRGEAPVAVATGLAGLAGGRLGVRVVGHGGSPLMTVARSAPLEIRHEPQPNRASCDQRSPVLQSPPAPRLTKHRADGSLRIVRVADRRRGRVIPLQAVARGRLFGPGNAETLRLHLQRGATHVTPHVRLFSVASGVAGYPPLGLVKMNPRLEHFFVTLLHARAGRQLLR